MNEDQARSRMGHGPQNLAVLRHMALNLVRKETAKGSLPKKLRRAAWSDAFLARPLRSLRSARVPLWTPGTTSRRDTRPSATQFGVATKGGELVSPRGAFPVSLDRRRFLALRRPSPRATSRRL